MEITVSQEQGRVPVTVFHLKGPAIESDQLQDSAKEASDAGAHNLVIDLLIGPVYHRLLLTGAPITRRVADHLVDLVLRAVAADR